MTDQERVAYAELMHRDPAAKAAEQAAAVPAAAKEAEQAAAVSAGAQDLFGAEFLAGAQTAYMSGAGGGGTEMPSSGHWKQSLGQ